MPLKDNQELVIKKSNDLIQARYKLTMEEQRLILQLASMIHKDDEDFKSYEIRVADFVQMFGLEKRKSIYTELEESSKRLTGKTIELSRDGKKIYASWLSYVEYVEGSGTIKVEFHKSLKPYLLQLNESIHGFTRYNLSTVINFKSSYSIRLYELLKMEVWKAEKVGKKKFEKVFKIEEYREILGIYKKAYPVFADLKRWTIEPPVREISDQTELHIYETEYLKTGRKITSVCFHVQIRGETETKLRQDNLRIDDIKPEKPQDEDHPIIQALMGHGFTWENARAFKNKHGVKKIERSLAYMKAEKANGKKIVSEASYITKAVQEDWGLALEQEKEKQIQEKKNREQAEKQKREQEEKERSEIAERHQKALNIFHMLPESLKPSLLQDFKEQFIDDKEYFRDKWNEAKKMGKDPIDGAVKSMFTNFLIQKGF